MAERTVKVDLGDGVMVMVAAEQSGPQLVADKELLAKFSAVTDSVERVSRDVLQAIKSAKPDKATIELGFGLAIEEGKLIALFGRGKGEASINVTLEWSDKEG